MGMNFTKLSQILEKYSKWIRKDLKPGSGSINFGKEILSKLAEVETVRKSADAAVEALVNFHPDLNRSKIEAYNPLAHIRATPNNPTSSRGVLFIMLDIKWRDGTQGNVVVADLA